MKGSERLSEALEALPSLLSAEWEKVVGLSEAPQRSRFPRGPLRGFMWGEKAGSICYFAFSLVLQCLGIQR